MKYGSYTITKTFSLKLELWDRFINKVNEHGFKVSEVIVMLIERWLSEED